MMRANSATTCPSCGGFGTMRRPSGGFGIGDVLLVGTLGLLAIVPTVGVHVRQRTCDDCGATYVRPMPRWIIAVGLTLALAAVSCFVGMIVSGNFDLSAAAAPITPR